MTLFIWFGFTKDGGKSGLIRASGEPFVAIDHPLIPLENRPGFHESGVGSGDVWLR